MISRFQVVLFVIDRCFAAVLYEHRCHPIKELIHMIVNFDPVNGAFIDKSFNKCILIVGQCIDKNPGICDFLSVRIDDLGRISSPVNFYLLAGITRDMQGNPTLSSTFWMQ